MTRVLRNVASLVLAGVLALACDTPATVVCRGALPSDPRVTPLAEEHAATDLMVRTASCWLGGLWGDVQGEEVAERAAASRQRCNEVIELAFGHPEPTKLEQLRALDDLALIPVRRKIIDVATADKIDAIRVSSLEALFDAMANASREAMDARRAGARVLRDIEHEPARTAVDEEAALPALERADALERLLRLDADELRIEANVLGLLVALGRTNDSRALPVHLKSYACAGLYAAVFHDAGPSLPGHASTPPGRGTWLTLLRTTAAAAQHPVADGLPPERAKLVSEAAILLGFADRLQVDVTMLEDDSPVLGIAEDTVARLRLAAKSFCSDAGARGEGASACAVAAAPR